MQLGVPDDPVPVITAPADRVIRTFHPLIAVAPAVAWTMVTKPPGQDCTVRLAVQPLPGGRR